jgi:hydrogenase expression/formation protein HypC
MLIMCLAIPGRIESVNGVDLLNRTAVVDFDGVKTQVSLAFLPEARVGQYVLVHAGVAINTVDEEEAARVFDLLKEMGEWEREVPEET